MKEILISYYDNVLLYHPNIFFIFLILIFSAIIIAICILIFFFFLYLFAFSYFLRNKKIDVKKRGGRFIRSLNKLYIRTNKKTFAIERKINKIIRMIKKEIFLPE